MKDVARLALTLSLGGTLALIGPAPAEAARGGPDAGGWRWADSRETAVNAVVETPATWTTIASPIPAEAVLPVTLSFPFTLYEVTSSTVYLSSNGWISLVDPGTAAVPDNPRMPDPAVPNPTLAFLWDDLGPSLGSYARHGATPNGHLIELYDWHAAASNFTRIDIQFYRSGAVKIVYRYAPTIGSATVGIENGTGTIGTELVYNGATAPGLQPGSFVADYAILFYPLPPSPACLGAAPAGCPGTYNGTTATGSAVTSFYGCSANAYLGKEVAYTFTQRATGSLDASLSGLGTRDLDLLLIGNGCDTVMGCIAGGSDTIRIAALPPGTYYLVVDGRSAADDGTFTLTVARTDLDCNQNGAPDACDVVSGSSADCNGNQVPDECDVQSRRYDCNQNRVPDSCDIAAGTSGDCNQDGRPDECPGDCAVNVVFVMDTSGSMDPVAAELCTGIGTAIARLASEGIDFRAAIWGITNVPPRGQYSCLTDNVRNRLGSAVPGPPVPVPANIAILQNDEDWGPATAIVAGLYPWDPAAIRVVVPIGDEGPRGGNPVNDPGDDRDSIQHAISVALANGVLVSPISPTIAPQPVQRLAQDLATGTGGEWFFGNGGTALADAIVSIAYAACGTGGGGADAGPDQSICGPVPVELDGSASTFTCAAGREYRWLDGTTEVCGWSTAPTCQVSPTGTTVYTLEVRCPSNPTCTTADTVSISQSGGATPGDLGNTLRAVRAGLDVTITGATIANATTYNLYRGVTKGVWPPAFQMLLPGAAITLTDVPFPPMLYFYRWTGSSCAGIEGL